MKLLKSALLNFILVIFISHLSITDVLAQAIPDNLTPQTPEVASLFKFSDIPVNHFTGIPNISIPVYTIKENDITVPITLNYHSSGIKVEEDASWIGLGWNLAVGGVISQIIVDLNDVYHDLVPIPGGIRVFDRQPTAYELDGLLTWLDQSYGRWDYVSQYKDKVEIMTRYGAQAQSNNIMSNYIYSYIEDDLVYVGSELFYQNEARDIFNFSFNGYGGKFYLDNDRNPVIIDQQNIKFTHIGAYGYADEGWKAITEDGTEYYFTEKEIIYRPEVRMGSNYDICNFYLKKIKSQSGEINFFYKRVGERINNLTYSELIKYPIETVGNYSDYGILHRGTGKLSKVEDVVYLDRIEFSKGRVEFKTDDDPNNIRTDVYNSKRLKEIQVFNNSSVNPILRKGFSHSYFIGHSSEDYCYLMSNYLDDKQKKRLKLDGFYNISTSGEHMQEYAFTYNLQQLPYKCSKEKDFWGYFNGAPNRYLLPDYRRLNLPIVALQSVAENARRYIGNREPEESKAKAGILNPTWLHPTLLPFITIIYKISGTLHIFS